MKRKEILEGCPDRFYNTLDERISSVEHSIGDIIDEFESVGRISDLYKIESAIDKLRKLKDDLY